ncbi:hypothetical protein CISG_01974 [Coccidioides immitis RMSCC 3703]|uniref:Uncharacterized protein n=2 Tax=Coccidioides immitis TaxID=5501 RepID=A0A0J8R485_COCIT|nr:hypothetical protein CIRG_07845 [Coccidioides immitis RMSCC 2394]KMU79556.1 hypothetical protein CISG_01974 [Coccidioides immitis RMSCC 3703]
MVVGGGMEAKEILPSSYSVHTWYSITQTTDVPETSSSQRLHDARTKCLIFLHFWLDNLGPEVMLPRMGMSPGRIRLLLAGSKKKGGVQNLQATSKRVMRLSASNRGSGIERCMNENDQIPKTTLTNTPLVDPADPPWLSPTAIH